MDTKLQIHPVQANILVTLLFKSKTRFSTLNVLKIPNDHFAFHLKRLVASGLVKKVEDGKYQLTRRGKEFANRFDTENIEIERQAKIGVLVVCVRKEKKQGQLFLIQQRLKEPYYGFYGFVTGKVRWGETVEETAKRELKEETGLSGRLEFLGVRHKMDYNEGSELLEDKFFFVFRATNLEGSLIEKYEGGENVWLTEKQALSLPNLFDAVDDSIKMAKGEIVHFSEKKFKARGY